jgi:hypothetical protein
LNRVRRDDGDKKVAVCDLACNRADKRVADVQDDLVVADVEPLSLKVFDEREDELLILVGVAEEGRGHGRSLRAECGGRSPAARAGLVDAQVE